MRPFDIATDCPDDQRPGNLQVAVELGSDARIDELLAHLQALMASTWRVGDWGGYSGQRQPSQSRMKVLQVQRIGARLEYDLAAEGIDPGFEAVLQNLVHAFHVRNGPVRSLRLGWSVLAPSRAAAHTLPWDFEPCPFVLDFELEHAQVGIEAVFAEKVDPRSPEAREVLAALDAWTMLAMSGGFCDESYPAKVSTLNVADDWSVSSAGMNCLLDDVAVADEAFSSLINIVQTVHHRWARIESLGIG